MKTFLMLKTRKTASQLIFLITITSLCFMIYSGGFAKNDDLQLLLERIQTIDPQKDIVLANLPKQLEATYYALNDAINELEKPELDKKHREMIFSASLHAAAFCATLDSSDNPTIYLRELEKLDAEKVAQFIEKLPKQRRENLTDRLTVQRKVERYGNG